MKQVTTKSDLVTKDYFNLKLKEEVGSLRNEIMDKLDYIVGELETAREDRVIAVHQTTNIEESLEDHEKRIKKLEALKN